MSKIVVDYGNSASGGGIDEAYLKGLVWNSGGYGVMPYENGVTQVNFGSGYTQFYCKGYTSVVATGETNVYVYVADENFNWTNILNLGNLANGVTIPSGAVWLGISRGNYSAVNNKVITFS